MSAEEQATAEATEQAESTAGTPSYVLTFSVKLPTEKVVIIPQPVAPTETSAYLKSALLEMIETSCYCNYRLEFLSTATGGYIVLNDAVEFNQYLEHNAVTGSDGSVALRLNFELVMVPELYDMREIRIAMKRTQDVIRFPPCTRAVFSDSAVSDSKPEAEVKPLGSSAVENLSEEEAEKKKQEDAGAEEAKVTEELVSQCRQLAANPFTSAASVFASNPSISKFYAETLARGNASGTIVEAKEAAEAESTEFNLYKPDAVVTGIAISGWNPPPPNRVMQGDLMYLEVHLGSHGADNTNKCLYVTVVKEGFFVNCCTHKKFDPSPVAPTPTIPTTFSHDLFTTIMLSCPLLQKSWNYYVVNKKVESTAVPGVYDAIAKYYMEGRGDELTATKCWLYPPEKESISSLCNSVNNHSLPVAISKEDSKKQKKKIENVCAERLYKHTYDMGRAQSDMWDSYGLEEKGLMREWNEELQEIRSLPSAELNERILKARLQYKLTVEFTESCKSGVMAIDNGSIQPLNADDSPKTYVYVHNNVFFSRACDTKESIRLCDGDDAARKAAAQELKNQKLITALGIHGLSTVLATLIDYKGDRYVCQTIIPGILLSGNAAAKLKYGILENDKRISVKNDTLDMMEKLGNHLFLKKRNIPIHPVKSAEGTVNAGVPEDSMPQSIKIDLVDEVDVVTEADGSDYVPHVGPIEAKILEGSDGRMYSMEMVRLTPRDANYVPTAANGTGCIDDKTLEGVCTEVSSAYVLRHELVHQYVAQQMQNKQQEIMLEYLKTTEGEKQAAVAETADKEGAEGADEASKEEKKIIPDAVKKSMEAITMESVGLDLNVNCYTNVSLPSNTKADEETIKVLCKHLFDEVLPSVTERVLSHQLQPQDGSHLCTLLHGHGINMRYLGRLCKLAIDLEEKDRAAIPAEDAALIASKQQTDTTTEPVKSSRNFMPLFWLELLESEVIARCVKHVLNEGMRSELVKSAPAAYIAQLLNAIIGTNGASETNELASASETSDVVVPAKQGKKGKKHQNKVAATSPVVSTGPSAVVVNNDVKFYRQRVVDEARNRFCAELSLFNVETGLNTLRINQACLTRRICQVTGIRIAAKEYDFDVIKEEREPKTEAAAFTQTTATIIPGAKTLFTVEDVMQLTPIVKSSEPDIIFAEARQVLDLARMHMNQGKESLAFEFTNEALNWLQQIVGPMHKEFLNATNLATEIFVHGGDVGNAFNNCANAICLAVQLKGFDNLDTLRCHMGLSSLYHVRRDYISAVQHMLAAKYLVQLLGGYHHPEIVNTYLKLGSMFCEIGGWDIGLKCLEQAKARTETTDPTKYTEICLNLADMMARLNMFGPASELQKQAYMLTKFYRGGKDARTVEVKQMLEAYMRADLEQKKQIFEMNLAKTKQAREQEMRDMQEAEEAKVRAELDALILSEDKKKKKRSSKKK